jgi:hypothetical protein
LSTIRGVTASEVTDLHPLTQAGRKSSENVGGPVEFVARLRWEPAAKDTDDTEIAAIGANAHPRVADKPRGGR